MIPSARDRGFAKRLVLHKWKMLEMEEQAWARSLMRQGVMRLAYVPYPPGEHRLEFTAAAVEAWSAP